MSLWEALVLGVVQGLTEFFPVSSSGHLVITEELLGLAVPGIAFDVALHVATLVSVLIVYRARIARLARGLFTRGEGSSWPFLLKLALASVPAAVVGIAFQDWFEARFDDSLFAGTMILVTGSFVWSSRWAREGMRSAVDALPVAVAAAVSVLAGTAVPFLAVLAVEAAVMALARLTARAEWAEDTGWGGAAFMGIAQAVAILPGISRSGSTVVTGLWRRIDPVAAAEFSFLMSVPAIVGAALLSLPDLSAEGSGVAPATLAAGALAAAISGIFAIRFFVGLLRRQNFHIFAYYCWVAGALFVLTR
jgi:undecaprenyl-diphosphatase